ncbi:peptidoglycan bridge formation glycyltransferase FemA/FemB family protein [bacterium]|nr:peptidoglycan bridge formation glycyltransferase FemA/FemB family protein [bacterium]
MAENAKIITLPSQVKTKKSHLDSMRLIAQSTPFEDWDEILYRAGGEAGLCQSSYWGRVIKKMDKSIPFFIKVMRSNEITACCLIFKMFAYSREKRRRTSLFPYIEIHNGPVIICNRYAVPSIDFLLSWIVGFAKKNFAESINFGGFSPQSIFISSGEVIDTFKRHGFISRRWGTFLTDLSLDEDALFRSLRHSARKNIKKCKEENILVKKINNIDEYYEMFYKTYKASEEYYGRKCNPFSKIPYEEDKNKYYHYFIAQQINGSILATIGMYVFNRVATEIMSTLAPSALKQKIPAQDILHWEMMLEAKRLGCLKFDLAGVNPNPQTSKEAGIRRFKGKWGGDYIEYYTFKKDMNPFYIRDIAIPLKKTFSPFYKKIRELIVFMICH